MTPSIFVTFIEKYLLEFLQEYFNKACFCWTAALAKALLTKRQFFSIPQNGKLLPALTFIEEHTTIDPLAAF